MWPILCSPEHCSSLFFASFEVLLSCSGFYTLRKPECEVVLLFLGDNFDNVGENERSGWCGSGTFVHRKNLHRFVPCHAVNQPNPSLMG